MAGAEAELRRSRPEAGVGPNRGPRSGSGVMGVLPPLMIITSRGRPQSLSGPAASRMSPPFGGSLLPVMIGWEAHPYR